MMRKVEKWVEFNQACQTDKPGVKLGLGLPKKTVLSIQKNAAALCCFAL